MQDWRTLFFDAAYKNTCKCSPPPLSPFLFLSSYLSQVHDRRLFEFKRWLHKLYTVSRATSADSLAVSRQGKPRHWVPRQLATPAMLVHVSQHVKVSTWADQRLVATGSARLRQSSITGRGQFSTSMLRAGWAGALSLSMLPYLVGVQFQSMASAECIFNSDRTKPLEQGHSRTVTCFKIFSFILSSANKNYDAVLYKSFWIDGCDHLASSMISESWAMLC